MKSHKKALCWVLSITALTLLLSIPLACSTADESVQRELGNLPPATPALPALHDPVTQLETDSPIAGAMTVPTPTLALLPVEYQGTPGVTSGSPQEDPEEENTPTTAPTKTPYPTDFVKPTELPTPTPIIFPTDAPPSRSSEKTGDASTLASEVTRFTDQRAHYAVAAISHVRVVSHRTVEPDLDEDWPNDTPPYEYLGDEPMAWKRTVIEAVETLHGTIPDNYELMTLEPSKNQWLEQGKEYILFIREGTVLDSELTGDANGRYVFNEDQLEAFGGHAGLALHPQLWIIDGDTAWRLPGDHLWNLTKSSDLAAARAGGENLSVVAMKAAIRAGLKR